MTRIEPKTRSTRQSAATANGDESSSISNAESGIKAAVIARRPWRVAALMLNLADINTGESGDRLKALFLLRKLLVLCARGREQTDLMAAFGFKLGKISPPMK